MSTYRFRIDDTANPWAKAIEIDASDPDTARELAGSYLFARRTTGDHDMLVRLTEEPA
jgi:hypothetical protein